jgi:hypothetical protein
MRKEEPNVDVRTAGVTAFFNALEFIRGNMEKEVRVFFSFPFSLMT